MKVNLHMAENMNCSYQLEAISCYCSIYQAPIEVPSKKSCTKSHLRM